MWCLICNPNQTVDVDTVLQNGRQTIQTIPNFRNFLRILQSQMPVAGDIVLYIRHISENTYLALFFNQILQLAVSTLGDLVQDHALNIGILPEVNHPFDHRNHRQAHAFSVHKKHDGRAGDTGQIVGRSLCTDANSVIEAHNAFHYGELHIFTIAGKKISRHLLVRKISIQVPGTGSHYTHVEHRINVIRSALE